MIKRIISVLFVSLLFFSACEIDPNLEEFGLSEIALDEGVVLDQEFSSGVTNYVVRVDESVEILNLIPELIDSGSTYEILKDGKKVEGAITLDSGLNIITILVHSKNFNEVVVYTISAYRNGMGNTLPSTIGADNDATLKSIGGVSLLSEFKPELFDYTAHVDISCSSILLVPVLNNSKATYRFKWATNYMTGSIPLESTSIAYTDDFIPIIVPNNEIIIEVMAADKKTVNQYTLNIARYNMNTIKILDIQGIKLDQTFDPNIFEYTATVDSATSYLSLNFTTEIDRVRAYYTINGSSSRSRLNAGENIIKINSKDTRQLQLQAVGAKFLPDPSTESRPGQIYTIQVIKPAHNEMTVTDISLSLLNINNSCSQLDPIDISENSVERNASYGYDSLKFGINSDTDTEKVSVSASFEDGTTLIMNGQFSNEIFLKKGTNIFTFTIESEDGSIVKQITLSLMRPRTENFDVLLDNPLMGFYNGKDINDTVFPGNGNGQFISSTNRAIRLQANESFSLFVTIKNDCMIKFEAAPTGIFSVDDVNRKKGSGEVLLLAGSAKLTWKSDNINTNLIQKIEIPFADVEFNVPPLPIQSDAERHSTSLKLHLPIANVGQTSVDIYRSLNVDTGFALVQASYVEDEYLDEGLAGNTVYYYKVILKSDVFLDSDLSQPVSFTTSVIPVAPFLHFAGTLIAVDSFQLGWNESVGATSYLVEYSPILDEPGFSQFRKTALMSGLTMNFSNLAASTTYYVRVTAYDGAQKGGTSFTTGVTTAEL